MYELRVMSHSYRKASTLLVRPTTSSLPTGIDSKTELRKLLLRSSLACGVCERDDFQFRKRERERETRTEQDKKWTDKKPRPQ